MKSITSPPRGCKGVLRVAPTTLRTEFVTIPSHEGTANCACSHYYRLAMGRQSPMGESRAAALAEWALLAEHAEVQR
jgi:hypothetical protein